jgi:hypothetical protein
MKSWFTRNRLFLSKGMYKTSTNYNEGSEAHVLSRSITHIIILFCTLEILDAIVTYLTVNAGLVWEGNKLISQLAGNWSFILLKSVGAVLSGFILKMLYEHFPKVAMAAAVSIVVFYGAVLAWNSGIIVSNILLL